MRRLARVLGLLMIVGGLGAIAWAVTVWQWQDPVTAVYAHYQQDRLASALERRTAQFVASAPAARGAASPRAARTARSDGLALDARRYRRLLGEGDALGRLRVPRLGLSAVVVNGTAAADLEKGPGRYLGSGMPGEQRLVYVAGHRTTYGAPFSRIDALRPGDPVTLELPYGRFEYAVTRSRIVDDRDLSVLRSRGREELVLQACHPRFFASHRYLVYARLLRVRPLAAPARRATAVAAPARQSSAR
jgi:sortase A